MGKLDLSQTAAMAKGGTKGPAIVKGDASRSLLYTRIADRSMPFGEQKVPPEQARIIREWIDAGAHTAQTPEVEASTAKQVSHWAFSPPRRPTVPGTKSQAWVRTPVDAFVLARLEEKRIRPVAAAEKPALLRRVYLDLIGLPPPAEEQQAFVDDPSPDAYDRVVDRLLSRPQYGERWARHWLDVVRYAESNGYERDGAKPNAWRYRDYVIDAFNKDKPYDRFLTEQLAGDEVEGSNAETQIATTFLRLGTWDDEPAEPTLDRYDQLDDVLGATSAAFLGVTLRCARCHDHKFEPFSQKDYYRTLAIFDPLKRPQDQRKDLDRLAGTEAELSVYRKATQKADEAVGELQRQVDKVRKAVMKRLFAPESRAKWGESLNWLDHAETVLAFATEASKRSKEEKALVEKFQARMDQAIEKVADADERAKMAGWKQEIAKINQARPKEPPRAYIWYEESPSAPPTRLLTRGDPSRPGEEVTPGVPAILGNPDPAALQPTAKSTGRRLWLARWMTGRDNPLVARVIVNRLWQWHFGEGIVASENDFGVIGLRPTHPELLDYLATELMDSGWSLKHVQKLILKSSAYRLSAEWNEDAAKVDPENSLLWRWKPRRLDAEAVRDVTLAISGQLNPEMAGPSVHPPLPRAVLEGQSVPGAGWKDSDPKQSARRSVYIFVKRSLAVPELEMLDSPDTTSSCEQRSVSTTGPQALAFLNGEFTQGQARQFAARLEREAGPETEAQLSRAFQLAVNRRPSPAELSAGREFLSKQQRIIAGELRAAGGDAGQAAKRAMENFALVLLNTNEFFYVN